MDQVGITVEDQGHRIHINGTVAHDKETALKVIEHIFAQLENIKVPENHVIAETNFSSVLTVSIVPIVSGKITKISEIQIEFIRVLAQKMGVNPYHWARDLFDTELPRLNRMQAYAMIAAMEKGANAK